MVVTFLFIVTLFVILPLFGVSQIIIPYSDTGGKIIQYIKSGLLMIPVYFLLTFAFKKNIIINLQYDEKKIKKGYIFLIISYFIWILFLVACAFQKEIIYMLRLHYFK